MSTSYHISIPVPGVVLIEEETNSTSYTELSLRQAIAKTLLTRFDFESEEQYQAALKMYQDALKLLLEDWS